MTGGVFGVLPEFRHGSAMLTAPITRFKFMGHHAGLEFLTPPSPCIAIEITDHDRLHVRMRDMRFNLAPIPFQIVILLHYLCPYRLRHSTSSSPVRCPSRFEL